MAEDLITMLNLETHPYGGFFKEVHRSIINVKPLGDEREARSSSTCIYLLMNTGDIDPWHRMKSDETFFYHKGAYLKLYTIDPDGALQAKVVGDTTVDPDAVFAYVIPAGVWFAGELVGEDESYGFFSVSVSPGFDFRDSEVGHCDQLANEYPQHKELIERLCIHPETTVEEKECEDNNE